jgi:hypothetical protein
MMLLLANFWSAQIWNLVPLILVISLVYAATRHEHLKEIITQAIRGAVWLTVFLGIIFGLVWWATLQV